MSRLTIVANIGQLGGGRGRSGRQGFRQLARSSRASFRSHSTG
jgi:hypothetical protein